MTNNNNTLSFKSSPRINTWIDTVKDIFDRAGRELNQSEMLREAIEQVIDSEPNAYMELTKKLEKKYVTLANLYEKIRNKECLLDHSEVHFLLLMVHQGYLNYPCKEVSTAGIKELICFFRDLLAAGKKEGWSVPEGDSYYAGNLMDGERSQNLYDSVDQELTTYLQLNNRIEDTLDYVESRGSIHRSTAEMFARNPEVIFPKMKISTTSLNSVIKPYIETIFSIAVAAYRINSCGNDTFVSQENDWLSDVSYKEYTSGSVSLNVRIEGGNVIYGELLLSENIQISLEWRSLYQGHRVFNQEASVTEFITMNRVASQDKFRCNFGNGMNIYISEECRSSTANVLNSFFTDEELKLDIEECKLLLGHI